MRCYEVKEVNQPATAKGTSTGDNPDFKKIIFEKKRWN